jgi:hypothetical protein
MKKQTLKMGMFSFPYYAPFLPKSTGMMRMEKGSPKSLLIIPYSYHH